MRLTYAKCLPWRKTDQFFPLQGQRQKKLEAKNFREAIEEEERKQIDIEEAKYQAQIRKEAIEKAKTQQYYQSDRVKGFHVRVSHYSITLLSCEMLVETISLFFIECSAAGGGSEGKRGSDRAKTHEA